MDNLARKQCPGFVPPGPISAVVLSSSFLRNTVLSPSRRPASSRVQATLQPGPPRKQNASNVAKAAAASTAAAAAAFILSLHPSPASLSPHLPTLVQPAQAAARGGGASFLSASGDVIKDPESLLRWALPISNRYVRELQSELEYTVNDLRGLKWQKVEGHVKGALRILNAQSGNILSAVPADKVEAATERLSAVADRIPDIEAAIAEKKADKVTRVCREVLRDVGRVEEMMVTNFPYQVPEEFSNLPQLKGRATVEMVVRKAGGGNFDIEGTLYPEGHMTMVLDGYSAPVSAGSFADLVSRGFYNNKDVIRSDGFIIQAGKPKDAEGFRLEGGKDRTIPLEVFAKGDKMPTYGVTLEEDGRGALGTVLPFTSYGALAMARAEFEPNTASSQFFWFLFEPDLTPAGRNLMDGSWAIFGYTTEGENFLKGMQKGDVIVSAKLVDGVQNLVH